MSHFYIQEERFVQHCYIEGLPVHCSHASYVSLVTCDSMRVRPSPFVIPFISSLRSLTRSNSSVFLRRDLWKCTRMLPSRWLWSEPATACLAQGSAYHVQDARRQNIFHGSIAVNSGYLSRNNCYVSLPSRRRQVHHNVSEACPPARYISVRLAGTNKSK